MEDLMVKSVKCPNCNHHMEYWTKNNFIECIKCKEIIEVEPCEEKTEEELMEDEYEV